MMSDIHSVNLDINKQLGELKRLERENKMTRIGRGGGNKKIKIGRG